MTNQQKFDILAQRIKENARVRDTYNGTEYSIYSIWDDGYYNLLYREVNGNKTIFIEKETEIIGDKYIDYWNETYTPEDFDIDEFDELAPLSFLYLYEDLLDNPWSYR